MASCLPGKPQRFWLGIIDTSVRLKIQKGFDPCDLPLKISYASFVLIALKNQQLNSLKDSNHWNWGAISIRRGIKFGKVYSRLNST